MGTNVKKADRNWILMGFPLKEDVYRKLKIFSVVNRVDMRDVLLRVVSESKEIKNIYAPIKGFKKIQNYSRMKRKDGYRIVDIHGSEKLNSAIKVIGVVNDAPASQILNQIIMNNHEDWLAKQRRKQGEK